MRGNKFFDAFVNKRSRAIIFYVNLGATSLLLTVI